MTSYRFALPTCTVALVGVGIGVSACGRANPVGLYVIAAPDGGDPFVGPDAATQVRIILEDDASAPRVEPVGPRGEFHVDVAAANAQLRARLRLEALRNGEVVATGATPPVVWGAQGGQLKAVLMHFRDALIPGPGTFEFPRAEAQLLPLGYEFVFVATATSDQQEDRPVDGYDLGSYGRLPLFRTPVPRQFDGDTAVVPVTDAWLFQRASAALLYTGVAATTRAVAVPAGRQPLVAATVVVASAGTGGWLVGGRDVATSVPSARVEQVSTVDGSITAASQTLQVARERPAVIPLRATSTAGPTQWLVAGGQAAGAPTADRLLETYSPDPGVAGALLPTGDAALGARVGAALLCIARSGDVCVRVLVLGGRTSDGAAAADDALLDGNCALQGGTNCTLVTARGVWFAHRRWDARVALAEGGRVVVAGGSDAAGLVHDVETIDVTEPAGPRPGRLVGVLPQANPAVLALWNGSVMLAGGRNADGTASSAIWFYRY